MNQPGCSTRCPTLATSLFLSLGWEARNHPVSDVKPALRSESSPPLKSTSRRVSSASKSCSKSTMAKIKGTTPPGHVNLRMLAEHLELSQTTVSLVLNNSPSAKSIPPETRQRVMEAAQRLNYRPNYFARSLRQSRSMSVGVLAPDLSEGYFTRVMSGVLQELTAAHYF